MGARIGRTREPASVCGVAAALAVAIAACGTPPEAPRHVLLITVDTLRADRLGIYGCDRDTSPALDALARSGTVFDRVSATCPATAPSVASILTGSHRGWHRVFWNGWKLADDVETLAEVLRERGYRTIGRVANPTVDAATGFGQGFDDFAMPAALERAGPGMLEGEPMVADARGIAAELGKHRSFVWLHFMDPHGPYFPPESVRREFAPDAYVWPGDHPLAVAPTNFGLGVIPAYQAIAGETVPASYRARYDAEVRYVDDHIAAVLEAYRAHGLLERTLVVVTGVHGESLGDHDYYFAHGWFAHEDALRVPLVLAGPGIPAGRRVGASVSLVDLAPTVLDLVGLPATATMEGRSLRPLVAADGPDREAFSQTYYGEGLVALRAGDLKYVFKPQRTGTGARPGSDPPFPDAPAEWLFDLAADPGETKNLAPGHPRLATFRGRVQTWLTEQERRGHGRRAEQQRGDGTATRVIGDPQLERQLRALGYVE